jgi:hypothetical protein
MSRKNLYKQPTVNAVAPDAIIYIDQGTGKKKRTITLKTIDDAGEIKDKEVDIMQFVSTISTSKGIDKVPSDASITLRSPKHFMYQIYGSLKNSLSTMQEIEIYMKGRFLLDNEPQYYPAFWGVISNLSESEAPGDLLTVTVSCQDMMRWLAVTKVNVQPSALNARIADDPTANVPQEQVDPGVKVHPFSSLFVGLSTPGIIRELFNASTSAGFLSTQNVTNRGSVVQNGTETVVIDNLAPQESQLIDKWQITFDTLSSALFIYGYESESSTLTAQNIRDVMLNTDAYSYIYGFADATNATGEIIKKPLIDLTKMFAQGAEAFNTQTPPTFASNFQDRLAIALEVKDQVQLEFYQDTDGTIVLKPQFFNMDTRQNAICVIDDIDILNFNEIEDESSVITRVDVSGVIVSGMTTGSPQEANTQYGFAIDYDKMSKYGLRVSNRSNNWITSSDFAYQYAARELARQNSLITNGSLTIQGRPELKLGYPVFITSRDMFAYVTAIEHSFTFGSSFETTLTLTAFRKRRYDNQGEILKNLLVQTDGSKPTQTDSKGSDVLLDADNPMKNVSRLCDPESVAAFIARRPNYRLKSLDSIMQYQGTFKYIRGEEKKTYDPRIYQQVTDNEGYDLIGNGYPFAKDLILTEDFRIIIKGQTTSSGNPSELALNMSVKSDTGVESPTLRFQQPLTLDQVEEAKTVRARAAIVDIPLNMEPAQSQTEIDWSKLTNLETLRRRWVPE